MEIYLKNTGTQTKELFFTKRKTLFGKPKVSMYHCGPTVYHYPHIGNLRAYVFADTLKRLMKAHGYAVRQAINITDVGHLVGDGDTGEDKMEKAREREHKSSRDIARFYTSIFFQNLQDLNIDTKGTKFPRATAYIKEQIAIVKDLESKGFTYTTSDGVYFDTSKFPTYGKLGNINLEGIREGERIGKNDEKKHPTDFALWKFSPENVGGKKRDQEWKSPWGIGFPGWHIECSAMSMALLGKTLDIHTGGVDHIPVHHNNEIAQSEASTNKHFVRFWMHSEFVNVDGGKMAKSEDNFLTLQSLTDKGFSPMHYRYLLLGARYSSPIHFSWESLESARNGYENIFTPMASVKNTGKLVQTYVDKAISYLSDDLDTPKILALIREIWKDQNVRTEDRKATICMICEKLLGLREPKKNNTDTVPEVVKKLLEERKRARDLKDWKKSDELRDSIMSFGFKVKDAPQGQTIERL